MVLFMLVAISAKSLEKYIYVNDTQLSRYLCWTLNSALYTTSSTADYMGGLEQEVLVMQASIKSNLWATSLRT